MELSTVRKAWCRTMLLAMSLLSPASLCSMAAAVIILVHCCWLLSGPLREARALGGLRHRKVGCALRRASRTYQADCHVAHVPCSYTRQTNNNNNNIIINNNNKPLATISQAARLNQLRGKLIGEKMGRPTGTGGSWRWSPRRVHSLHRKCKCIKCCCCCCSHTPQTTNNVAST